MTKLVKMKISIIGDYATGKTSLIRRYIDGEFGRDYRPTIGSNVFIKKIELSHKNEIYLLSVSLWEVAGQDRWQNVRKTYYSGSQALVFVGDLSRKRTFHQIKEFWYGDAIDQVPKNTPILILANKCDLPEDIDDNEIRDIKNHIHAFKCIKTSAKENIQINAAFLELIQYILDSSSEINDVQTKTDE